MSPSERHKTVVGIWRNWRREMRALNDGWFPYYDRGKCVHLFHEYLQAKHPCLLDMPHSNPYEQIKDWVFADLDS